ncbi:hypothetical protein ZYGR_0AD00450 [Zygosaccharomyces rouxii]|uniref:RNA polymerase II subunit B1 CTD phosphatase RPAP2 homolog n=2 Tax=Zygosaccharomyces rouxii TaxID=4956 RepID=C5DZT1_ZYGRC|nr:uncharacterized protein ZYRO0G06952g [Zygosaccharomyces rouxii]KAH9202362.1 Rtr1/RPAP2 family-domain-containing protein [Zygosaccharomyces rouxii]GAV50862.1 hypothetical protein ZYGR_0AD00450 [Zygosaccharomyces rouxii]CAR29365.1 ZYRO0G06952p [Zygosaccharomyces rouxii]
MTTVKSVQEEILKPLQRHKQLTVKEAEEISLGLIDTLCDSYCQDEATLQYLSMFFTPQLYQDLLDERNLNKWCGYPMCSRSPERIRDPFEVDDNTKRFLWENNPYAYLSIYCSKFHFRCSQFYQVQLSDESLFARTGIHLINQSSSELERLNEKYGVTLFEQLLREKASEDDMKSLVAGLRRLGIKNDNDNGTEKGDDQFETDLSKWLSDIKIVEHEEPELLGDLEKDG